MAEASEGYASPLQMAMIAAALSKNPSQVGRWLAMETKAYYNDSKEGEEIDRIVSQIVMTDSSNNGANDATSA